MKKTINMLCHVLRHNFCKLLARRIADRGNAFKLPDQRLPPLRAHAGDLFKRRATQRV